MKSSTRGSLSIAFVGLTLGLFFATIAWIRSRKEVGAGFFPDPPRSPLNNLKQAIALMDIIVKRVSAFSKAYKGSRILAALQEIFDVIRDDVTARQRQIRAYPGLLRYQPFGKVACWARAMLDELRLLYIIVNTKHGKDILRVFLPEAIPKLITLRNSFKNIPLGENTLGTIHRLTPNAGGSTATATIIVTVGDARSSPSGHPSSFIISTGQLEDASRSAAMATIIVTIQSSDSPSSRPTSVVVTAQDPSGSTSGRTASPVIVQDASVSLDSHDIILTSAATNTTTTYSSGSTGSRRTPTTSYTSGRSVSTIRPTPTESTAPTACVPTGTPSTQAQPEGFTASTTPQEPGELRSQSNDVVS